MANGNKYFNRNVENGFCGIHKGIPFAEGKKYCQPCLDRMKSSSRGAASKGMCTGHPNTPALPGLKQCQACFDRRRIAGIENNSNGFCRTHKETPVIKGLTQCKICVETAKLRAQDYTENGRCRSHPDNPVVPGTKTCQVCVDQQRIYVASRNKSDLNYRLRKNMRSRFGEMFKAFSGRGRTRRVSAVKDMGCTVEELKAYFASLFTDGMSWENYGKWHIDHIRPLCSFDLQDPEQQKMAVHYTNLQPLWAADNIAKGGRY